MDITSSSNNGVNVNSSNWSAGTGLIDDVNGLVKSIDEIKTAHGADLAATSVELGLEVVSTAIDTVAFALNPFAKLAAAGLGWLIEHIGVLTKALDLIAGDPDAIKEMADALHATATDLQNTADDLGSNLNSDLPGWTGAAADAFTNTMTGHQGHISAVGHAVDVTGYVVETNMALISALRNLIRDIITSTIADIITTFLAAVAAAPFTGGASLVAAMGWLATELGLDAASFAAKFAKVTAFFTRAASRLGQLGNALEDTHPNLTHTADDVPHTTGNPGTRGLPPGTKTGPEETDPGAVPHNDPNTASTSNVDPSKPTDPQSTDPQGDQTDLSSADEPNSSPPADHTAPTSTPTETPDSTSTGGGYGEDDDAFKTWLAADDHFNGPHSNGEPSGSTPLSDGDPSSSTKPSSVHDPSGSTEPSSAGTPSPEDEIVPNPHAGAAGVGDPEGKAVDTDDTGSINGEGPANGEGSGTTPPAEDKPQSTDENGNKDNSTAKPAKPKAKDSPLKKFDAKPLKKHEDWLKSGPLKKYFEGSKVGENYVKNHFPEAFPYAKAIADAKSSKNYVGLAVKGDVQEAKQLSDIQARAEKAHEQAEQAYRKSHEHPEDTNFSGRLL